MDLNALGFDIAEGVSDPYLPGDYGIFVSKVDKGSIAEGRLRYESSFNVNPSFIRRMFYINMYNISADTFMKSTI